MGSYKSFAFDINEVFEIQNNDMPDEFIDPNCVGHIRPHNKYADELGYGFDWMRVGDTTYNGETEVYKGIMGNLYKSKIEGGKKVIDCLETNINIM